MRFFYLILASILIVGVFAGSVKAQSLFVYPSEIEAQLNQNVVLEIRANATASDLYFLQYDIEYDHHLNFVSLTEGPMLAQNMYETYFGYTETDGSIYNIYIARKDTTGIHGENVTAYIRFMPDTVGTSYINLSNVIWVNSSITNTSVGMPEVVVTGGIIHVIDDSTDVICHNGETKPCGSSIGECEPGVRLCVNNDWSNECQNLIGPLDEICDGKDNNCNGIVDEDITGMSLTKTCGTDVGACVSGISTCSMGMWGACEGVLSPVEEICDGMDNDCDGDVDEVCECVLGARQECGSDVGACSKGEQACFAGLWQAECVGEIVPVKEICNEIDDDCDGDVDENDVCSILSFAGNPDSSWVYMIAAGVIILLILVLLVVYFKSKGRELTWSELSRKWNPDNA